MSTQNETAGIIEFISGHAAALNSANIRSIAEQYTADGILFPNGYPSVSKSKLDLSSGEFFESNKFKINYQIRDIAVSVDFAFVESSATAVIANLDGTNPVTKVSSDLFTLRKEKGAWKIYRYSFNDSTNKPSKKV